MLTDLFCLTAYIKYISYRCAVGPERSIIYARKRARENHSIRFQKFDKHTLFLRKRETEKEKDTVPRNGLKFWKKVSRQKNVSANVSLGTIPYPYVKRTTREGIEAPDLCHVRTSLVAEGLKLLPDLIARVTTCARM